MSSIYLINMLLQSSFFKALLFHSSAHFGLHLTLIRTIPILIREEWVLLAEELTLIWHALPWVAA